MIDFVKELKDLQKGDKVWHGCYSGFCDDSIQKVNGVVRKMDTTLNVEYMVIVVGEDNQEFDSRNGFAITKPYAYRIKTI